ncbi:MAG: retron system putative HNH endonuclease [Snowella sp.]|nr:retron system putative HNH endonuclease [Snowella sp.]
MRYIKKQEEPTEFSEWKAEENEDWKPYWSSKGTNFRGSVKKIVHESLLKEQSYICCYCQRRIDLNNSHIEHFKPKDEDCYPELSLDYRNFLASCQKEKNEQTIEAIPVHCGHSKGNWYDEKLTVSPLIEDCADFFHYTITGAILPSDDPAKKKAAKTTIEKLGLDRLDDQRLAVIRSIFDVEDLTQEDIKKLLIKYNQVDENGQYYPYCNVLIYLLKEQYELLCEFNSKIST